MRILNTMTETRQRVVMCNTRTITHEDGSTLTLHEEAVDYLTGLTKGTWTVFVRAVFAPFENIVTEAGQVDVT